MSKRYFTLAEANALVPRLTDALGRIMRLRVELRAAAQRMAALGEPLSDETIGAGGGSFELVRARGQARALVETLTEEQDHLDDLGVEVKDLDTGLCDFVVRREGRDVYLCWKLGEKSIGFWHELHTGLAGRQPLDTVFESTLH